MKCQQSAVSMVTVADVAQLVELQISNLNVASSNLVVRSNLALQVGVPLSLARAHQVVVTRDTVEP